MADPSLGRIKGKAACLPPCAGYPDRQLGWWLQPTLKDVPEVQQGSCSSCHPPSTLASKFLGGGVSPPALGRSPAEHIPAAGGAENKGCRKRSFSLEAGQETSVHTLKLGKSATRAEITPSGKKLSLVEKMAPSPGHSSTTWRSQDAGHPKPGTGCRVPRSL